MVVDPVLGVGGDRVDAEQPRRVGLVLAEQQRRPGAVRRAARHQLQGAQVRVLHPGRGRAGGRHDRLDRAHVPGPGVAEPRGRQDVQGVGVRPGVGHGDLHQQIGGIGLGVTDLGDPVTVTVEDAGVEQLVLGVELAPPAVFRPEVLVGERRLRVVVAPAVPGVAGQRVQVPPVLLDVLAVVRLGPGQPEGALLEYRIAAVPQRQPQAQPLLDVAEPGQAVLAPAVGPRARMVVRQVVPGLTVRAVVLANRPPLALAHVRPPQVPLTGLPQAVLKPPEPGHPVTFSAHRGSPSCSAVSWPLQAPRCSGGILPGG